MRDARVTAQQRLAEHRRPLDLEEECGSTADIPDAVDIGDLVGGPADLAERPARLAIVEPVGEAPRAEPAGLLALTDPDAHPEAMAAVGQGGDRLGVLLGTAEEVVGRDEAIGRAGHAAVAPEAGPDECLVGQVVTDEQVRHPLEECRLG